MEERGSSFYNCGVTCGAAEEVIFHGAGQAAVLRRVRGEAVIQTYQRVFEGEIITTAGFLMRINGGGRVRRATCEFPDGALPLNDLQSAFWR